MKKILFSTLALAAFAVAGAQNSRNLVVTDLEGKQTKIPADQIEAVVFQNAPEYRALTNVLGTSYEETGESSGFYLIEFGTSEPDFEGNPLEIGDVQIGLLIMAPMSENLNAPRLPAGYYTIGNSTQDFTFDVNRSAVWVRLEDGSDGVSSQMIFSGTVDVRTDENDLYDIRMELTTFGGSYDLRYQGELPFPPGVSEFGKFTEPVDVTFTNGQGRFYGNWCYPFAADLSAQFYVGTIVDGTLTEGYMLDIPFYEPRPADCMAPGQRVADGTYTVERRDAIEYTYLPFTFTHGHDVDFMGQVYTTGARITHIDASGHRKLGLITDGSFTVSGNGTAFEFDLVTAEGISIKGSYKGVPAIVNYCDNDEKEPKRPFSSLTEDVELNWDPATISIFYNQGHDILSDTNTFIVWFVVPSQDRGDYISLDLLCKDDKLADGTYTIGSTLAEGYGIPGAIGYGDQMLFSWYGDLSIRDSEGYNTKLAPIASGTVTVSTLENGDRKFVFDLKDDNGTAITGEYSGTLIDAYDNAAMARRLTKGKERNIRPASLLKH